MLRISPVILNRYVSSTFVFRNKLVYGLRCRAMEKNNIKLLHDVIHTHIHLDQDSDVSWDTILQNLTAIYAKTSRAIVPSKINFDEWYHKKNIRISTQRSALCKINRQAMRCRSHAIVKPLVVKHALCPVRALRRIGILLCAFCAAWNVPQYSAYKLAPINILWTKA